MYTYGANIALFCGQTAYFGQHTVGFNGMAFLPALTNTQSAQIVKRENKSRREVDKKSGYRISLANIAATRPQDSCNIARSPSDKNDNRIVKQDLLPPLEDKKRNFSTKQSHNEEDRTRAKPLKLPKCPNPVMAKKSMFWMEPLGVWVPLKQGRKLYEKFSSSMDLMYKDPDYLADPCPHIPRCDHSRSWSAVKLERQKFRELKQLRDEQLLEKAIDRYQNMQAFWLEQVNNRTEMLHTRPSHVRLQNFRKTTEGFLKPLDEAQRFERLLERQREWEEAWKLAYERRKKACRKKSPRHLLPRIVVTDYEFALACDEHVNASNQSYNRYFEERYEVVCTPVQSISPSGENLRTQSFLKRIQGINNKCRSGLCDPYTALERSEKGPASFKSNGHLASTEATAKDFESSAKLDRMDKIRRDFNPGNSEDYSGGDTAGISEGDNAKLGSSLETSVEHDSLLVTSNSSSGTSLDKVVTVDTRMDTSGASMVEMRLAEGIKQADYTAHLMSQLVPVPLGVSSRKIPDQQLTASSTLDAYHTADQARMHNKRQDTKGGAWLPRRNDVSPYLQIDLGNLTTVQQVATQGNPASAVKKERHKRWVTKFSLEFSQDGERWVEYQESGQVKVFTANFDLDTVVLNSLENAVETRYIRFRPKEWHNGIAMRVEVFGVNPFPETDGAEDNLKSPALDEEEEQGSRDVIEYLREENELVKDEIVVEKQEVETFFREKEGTLENIQYGLSIEGRAAPPTILHSPVPSLISPHEQQIQIDDFMAIQTCTQNLSLRDNPNNDSEAESSRSPETPDDSKETSSVNNEIVLSNSTSELTLLRDEKQEVPSHVTEENSTVTENDSSESDQPSTPQCDEVTNLEVTPVTSSPPTSPPPESWVEALERARADGSIRRQMMREKMAEERKRKLAMLKSKIRNPHSDHTSLIYEELDELGDFLEKYCIIGKSDVMIYKNIFEKFDEDNDGFLWPEEVLEALENTNSRLLTDSHLSYVFRVLEQCDCQADIGIGFRLFSVIAALSQRVAALNDRMKMQISKCDFKTIDYTLERVKMLFECYVNEVTMKISRTDLWIGLAAGGLRTAEATIDDYFSEKHSFDFLDFLTYLPLFQEIHGYVVENPLSLF